MASPVLSSASTIEYPSSDGQLMAESDFQRKPLTYGVEALDLYFQDRPDVYVSGNLFIYYEEGNPQASIAINRSVTRVRSNSSHAERI